MFTRILCIGVCVVAQVAAFLPVGPMGASAPALRGATCGMRRGAPALRMVDWSEPEEEYDGAGADRGQINKSTATGNTVSDRLANSKKVAAETNLGSSSGLGRGKNLKEGDRDPTCPCSHCSLTGGFHNSCLLEA
ncbi:hypothetical protein T484DRAFT_1791617 [Baffinella frigidus]|nr:hypothetical protein T484DRAFT_1791617 [Cryptophyta sp. CCMP2293]